MIFLVFLLAVEKNNCTNKDIEIAQTIKYLTPVVYKT
jgi:hypothetical protein